MLEKRIIQGEFSLIAEVGVNYYDIAKKEGITPLDAAKLMCAEAKAAGAHAVKFQTYKAETLASKYSPSYWDTTEETATSQYALFKRYDSFGYEEYSELSEYCKSIGIDFCSTAFDFESADYLNSLMDVYKISSSDLTNIPFIRYQAKKQKPILLSVGAGNYKEIDEAVSVIRSVNHQPLVLMHCVLEYPTPYSDANLLRIKALKRRYPDLHIGYSDHCKPDGSYDVIKAAYVLGAKVIEKHFTLDKNLPGNDHYHAMDPQDIRGICSGVSFIDKLMGEDSLDYLDVESSARENARRSIVARTDIPEGAIIAREMLTFKRPGIGVSPSEVEHVIGKRAIVPIEEDSILTKDMFD